MQLCEWDLVDHHRSQGIEKDLEGTEEGLPKNGVKKNSLETSWKVGVETIYPECFVVSQVVWPESSAIR